MNELRLQHTSYCNDEICYCGSFSPVIPVIRHVPLKGPEDSTMNTKNIARILTPRSQAIVRNTQMFAERLRFVREYADEIYEEMLASELQRFTMVNLSFDYDRPQLIALLLAARNIFQLRDTTIHLALYLLDYYLYLNKDTIHTMRLTTVACLMIAAKIEEHHLQLPKISLLNEIFLANAFSAQDFKVREKEVLWALDFQLLVPNVATFANFYSKSLVTLDEYRNWNSTHTGQARQLGSWEELNKSVVTLLFDIIQGNLSYPWLINIRPSLQAAASVAAARYLHNIHPIWNQDLERLTKYFEEDVYELSQKLIGLDNIGASRGNFDEN